MTHPLARAQAACSPSPPGLVASRSLPLRTLGLPVRGHRKGLPRGDAVVAEEGPPPVRAKGKGGCLAGGVTTCHLRHASHAPGTALSRGPWPGPDLHLWATWASRPPSLQRPGSLPTKRGVWPRPSASRSAAGVGQCSVAASRCERPRGRSGGRQGESEEEERLEAAGILGSQQGRGRERTNSLPGATPLKGAL